MQKNRVGEQEWELLRWISSQNEDAAVGATVGEAAEHFGGPRNLSRSTVVTMMERLRAKNYLTREKSANVYRYRPALAPGEAQNGLIARFVDKMLSGSVAPFAAYFAGSQKLTPDEMAQLSHLLAKLDGADNAENAEETGETP